MSIELRYKCDVCGKTLSQSLSDDDDATQNGYAYLSIPPGWLRSRNKHLCSGACYDLLKGELDLSKTSWRLVEDDQ